MFEKVSKRFVSFFLLLLLLLFLLLFSSITWLIVCLFGSDTKHCTFSWILTCLNQIHDGRNKIIILMMLVNSRPFLDFSLRMAEFSPTLCKGDEKNKPLISAIAQSKLLRFSPHLKAEIKNCIKITILIILYVH